MAQITTQAVLEPPHPPINLNNFIALNKYLSQLYNFDYLVWKRIGGYAEEETGYKNMIYQNSNNIMITGGILENVTIGSSSISGSTITLSNLNSATITNSSLSDSTLTDCEANQGSSTAKIKLCGTAYTNTTSATNLGIATTTLLQYNLPASSMNVDGSHIEIEGWGTFNTNANNKRVIAYFGATVLLDTGSLALNGSSWVINSTVIRTSANTQKAITRIVSSNALIVALTNISTPAENTANLINIKFTGQGAVDNDVVQQSMIVKFYNK